MDFRFWLRRRPTGLLPYQSGSR
ncbi:amidohydrolase family protein, partial [Vibrio parahaemolyticus 10296]